MGKSSSTQNILQQEAAKASNDTGMLLCRCMYELKLECRAPNTCNAALASVQLLIIMQ